MADVSLWLWHENFKRITWKQFREQCNADKDANAEILWTITSTRINNLPVFYNKLFSSGCIFVSDLFCASTLKPFNHWVTIGLTENKQCTFCEQKEKTSLYHLFYNCSIVNTFLVQHLLLVAWMFTTDSKYS